MRLVITLVASAFIAPQIYAEQQNTVEPLSNVEVIEHIRSELPQEKTIAERTQPLNMFDSLDSNRDEEVSLTEMRRHPTLANSFHQLDVNNDGVLDRREIQPLQDEVKGLRSILTLSALRII